VAGRWLEFGSSNCERGVTGCIIRIQGAIVSSRPTAAHKHISAKLLLVLASIVKRGFWPYRGPLP
jgi:hypothetical protein